MGKMARNWFKQHLVLSIVLGIFIVLILVWSFSPSKESSTTDFDKEDMITQGLTYDGYEVLSAYVSNYSADAPFFEWYNIEDNTICGDNPICYSDKIGVSVEMKSLGSRNEQIWDALIAMSVNYKDAFTYHITIKSPIDTCVYIIFGDTLRRYFEEVARCVPTSEQGYISLNDECFNSDGKLKGEALVRVEALRKNVNAEIDKYKSCS